MQEVFSKIIEKLEEKIKEYDERIERRNGACYFDETDKIRKLDDTANGVEQAIEIVKQEVEQYNNGWISCSERLPENNNVVLCWVVSKTIASGETFIIGSCDRGFWFLQTYEIGHHHFPVKDYEVIAWQPLPQPYHPKGE